MRQHKITKIWQILVIYFYLQNPMQQISIILFFSLMVTWFFLLPLLVTSVSFLILIFPFLITSLLSLVHVSTTSMIFVAYAMFLTLIPSAHLLFTPDLTMAIQCTIVFLRRS